MLPKAPLILSFDTSAAHCAVALVCGDDVLGKKSEAMSKGQAERLMPMLEELLAAANKGWQDLDAIAVGTGPGNFTGVRISVSTARGLALSLGVPAIGVSVFEALAFGTTDKMRICLDGRRGQIFWQDFDNGDQAGEPQKGTLTETCEVTTTFAGYKADELAASTESAYLNLDTTVDPANIAKVAVGRLEEDNPRPAPLYLRSADAALPSDPPPDILP